MLRFWGPSTTALVLIERHKFDVLRRHGKTRQKVVSSAQK